MTVIAREVHEALESGRAVVALESTLVAHGLPCPDNLATARQAEAAVRRTGAVPATIAVIDGQIRVGLDDSDLERVATSKTILKASRRDLGAVLAQRLDAAMTVSATLWIGRSAGIGVIATGGLGGVHRDAATSFDVSTDLDELARADGILVVCSGVKSILDMAATLEGLETRGVAVVGYRTGELPAFTTISSGLPVDWRVETPAEAAALVRAHRDLGLPAAVVLAQPVPEDVAIAREDMEDAIARVLVRAASAGVKGKAMTPYLLDGVRHETGGRSLRANSALVVANAGLAGEVAVILAAQRPEARI